MASGLGLEEREREIQNGGGGCGPGQFLRGDGIRIMAGLLQISEHSFTKYLVYAPMPSTGETMMKKVVQISSSQSLE